MIVVMVMVAQLRDYMKNLELYTFNGRISWYMNNNSMKTHIKHSQWLPNKRPTEGTK